MVKSNETNKANVNSNDTTKKVDAKTPQANEKEETDNDEEENIDIEEEDEDDEEEEEEDDDDDEYIEEIVIPKGWKTGISKCKRKYYYNEYNKDKWYLNYDTNGKHYFYNADNQSVWDLPLLFHESDEKQRGEEDKEKGFRQNFDEDLSTFKNLFNRLSMRQADKEDQKMANHEDAGLGGGGGGGATASIFPKLPPNLGSSFEQVNNF